MLLVKALKRWIIEHAPPRYDDGRTPEIRGGGRERRERGMHFDLVAIISEANPLYRAVRRSNRILDNAIIRNGVQA